MKSSDSFLHWWHYGVAIVCALVFPSIMVYAEFVGQWDCTACVENHEAICANHGQEPFEPLPVIKERSCGTEMSRIGCVEETGELHYYDTYCKCRRKE